MKSGTLLLDSVEIRLSHTRTRCELYISAGDGHVREKLASANAKALVAHLRAAELQFARGESIIRLEPRLRSRHKCTWFTRATLERFLQFVSTPEVLERVKIIGDELAQLEQVRVALSKTFSQEGAEFVPASAATLSPAELYQEGPNVMTGSGLSRDDKITAEASKRELLRAMDVRLVAVNQELYMAFCRAVSAGFDKGTVSDLMDFSQHFGAQRLWDACLQFVGLSKRMNIFRQLDEDCDSEIIDDASCDSEMSLESGTDTGIATETDDSASWTPRIFDSSLNVQFDGFLYSRAPVPMWDSNADPPGEISAFAGGTSVRVRSRWGPPERIQIYSLEPEVQDSDIPAETSMVEPDANGVCQQSTVGSDSGDEEDHPDEPLSKEHRSSFTSLQKQQTDKNNHLAGNNGTFFCRLQKMAQQVEARRLSADIGLQFTSIGISDGLQDFEAVKSPILADSVCSSEDGYSAAISDFSEEKIAVAPPQVPKESQAGMMNSFRGLENNLRDQDEIPTGGGDEQDEHVSTSSRRLSVQAAISLFESKRASIASHGPSKLVRQDSQNGHTLEKAIGRRWSGVGPDEASKMASKDPTVVLKCSEVRNNNQEQNFADKNLTPASKHASSTWPQHTSIHQSVTHSDDLISESKLSAQQWAPPHAPLAGGLQKQFKLELEKSLARNNWKHIPGESNASKSITGASQVSDSSTTRFCKNQVSETPLLKMATSVSKVPDVLTSSASKDEASKNALWNSTSRSNLSSRRDPKAQVSELHQIKSPCSPNSSNSAETSMGDNASSLMKSSQADQTPELAYVMETPKESQMSRRATGEIKNIQTGIGVTTHEGKLDWVEQNRKAGPEKPLSTESKSVRLKEDKSVRTSSKKDCSIKEPSISKPKQEIEGTGTAGHKFSSSETQHKIIRRNPTTLHNGSIDLHMQALVMMIDNNHQSSLNIGNSESCDEQEGRHYEHYRKLRDARQQKENPAKRAERETKLKYMKETLDRRKSEMENGSLGPSTKFSKEKTVKAGNIQLPKTTSMETLKHQKSLEEDGEGMHRDRRLSCTTSMASKSHTNMSPRVQPNKKGLSTLPRSSKAPFSSMNASSASSLRAVPSNSVVGRRVSNHIGAIESPMSQKVAEVKDIWRSSASLKVRQAVNGDSISSNSLSGRKDEEIEHGTPLRRKECISVTDAKPSSAGPDIALVTGSVNNTRGSAVHGVKSSFSRKERVGAMTQRDTRKHEVPSIQRNLDEEVSCPNIYPHGYRKAGIIRKEDSRKPFKSRNIDFSAQNTFSVASTSLDDEGEEDHAGSTDVDEASDIFVDACSDERVLSLDSD